MRDCFEPGNSARSMTRFCHPPSGSAIPQPSPRDERRSISDSPSSSRCRPCAGYPPRPPPSVDKPLHGGPLLVGYWARSRQTHSDQPLPSRRTKRTLARAAIVACLLIIGVLAQSFGGGELHPLQVLVFGLAVGGMGYNVYFLYRWFRAMARGGRKGTTLLIGAVWLIGSGVVSVITMALGFALGRGSRHFSRKLANRSPARRTTISHGVTSANSSS